MSSPLLAHDLQRAVAGRCRFVREREARPR